MLHMMLLVGFLICVLMLTGLGVVALICLIGSDKVLPRGLWIRLVVFIVGMWLLISSIVHLVVTGVPLLRTIS